MSQQGVSAQRVRGYLRRIRSDSLVRNSLYLMASTVVTGALGYIFWGIAAHEFSSEQVGIGAAVISLCSTAALLTYLGSYAILIERLPAREYSTRWTAILTRVCLMTAGVTAGVAIVAIPALLITPEYRKFFDAPLPIFIAVSGAAAWTLVNLLGAAFIAARRAGRLLCIQAVISTAKVFLILPLAAAGAGAAGLVGAWVASATLGVGVGVAWLVPRMGLGRRPGHVPRRRPPDMADVRPRNNGSPRHRRASDPPSAASVRHLIGQHLTSVGGAVTPLVLPVLVVVRLGATQNAYFYITWMLGLAFFMISPSVATAIFAEGVRAHSDLHNVVVKALRVIALMLAPAIAVMIVGGEFILGLFGPSYSNAGYALLVLLALSSVPDAVSNVAVAIFRVTDRLGYSTVLNLGILVLTLTGAWILMPRLGIVGVGVSWLAVQTLGAIASLPAYVQIRRSVQVSPAEFIRIGLAELPADAGLALLIDLARLQSLERVSGGPP